MGKTVMDKTEPSTFLRNLSSPLLSNAGNFIESRLVAASDLRLLKAVSKCVSLSFEPGTLCHLLKDKQFEKARWLAHQMDIQPADVMEMIHEFAGPLFWSEESDVSSDVLECFLDIVRSKNFTLRCHFSNHPEEDACYLSWFSFLRFLNVSIKEQHSGLLHKLLDVLSDHETPSEEIDNFSWVIKNHTSLLDSISVSFFLSQLQAHPKAQKRWEQCFPLEVSLPGLPDVPREDRVFVQRQIKASRFSSFWMCRSPFAKEPTAGGWREDDLRTLLEKDPDMAFAFFCAHPPTGLMPAMKNLCPQWKDWRHSNGMNLAFVWLYARPNKTLARRLVSWCPDLLQESVHGLGALDVLSEDDKAEVDQKLLRSMLHQKKLGLSSKASSHPPRRL